MTTVIVVAAVVAGQWLFTNSTATVERNSQLRESITQGLPVISRQYYDVYGDAGLVVIATVFDSIQVASGDGSFQLPSGSSPFTLRVDSRGDDSVVYYALITRRCLTCENVLNVLVVPLLPDSVTSGNGWQVGEMAEYQRNI